jgi:hypothetical protein
MQDDINNIDKPDAFSEIFRKKLENHQVPVDPNSWNEIEAKMKVQKRRIIPFWFWLSGSAVAVLALLFMLRPISESNRNTLENSKPTSQKEFIPTQIVAHEINKTAKVDNKEIGFQKPKTSLTIKTEKNISEIQTIKIDSEEREIVQNIASNSLKREEIASSVPNIKKDSVSNKKRIIPTSLKEDIANEPVNKKTTKNDWLLAASFGSEGGAPDLGYKSYDADIFSPSYTTIVSSSEPNYTAVLTDAKAFSKTTYNSPLSFGLVVRKNLDKTISVESGLVYTYLSTNFENNGVQQNNAKLHLHYIGIPLNLVGVVWRNSKWEIYISGGTMVEKGIRSIYVLNQLSGNNKITTTVSSGIDGFQWSVNGAIGTTYKLQRNIGIFFEPKLSYFFDNNQPISVRTDQPTVIGLTGGLRIQL